MIRSIQPWLLVMVLISVGCKQQSAQQATSALEAPASAAAPAAEKPATETPTSQVAALEAKVELKPCNRDEMTKLALAKGYKVLAGIKLQKSTAQSELLAHPEKYEGKTVRIEGPIVAICKGQGCWAALEDAEGRRVNLKVTDGEIDFRKFTKEGHYAVGEGVFTKEGHHGTQIQIDGAMIAEATCSAYAQ